MPNFTEIFANDSKKAAPATLPTNALFAQINKGFEVTSHLNEKPTLKDVVFSTIKSVVKPPVFELELLIKPI